METLMAVTHHKVTEEAYVDLVFANPDRKLELYDGEVREKPGVSYEHGRVMRLLCQQLLPQLDVNTFDVSINDWRVRRPTDTIFIPDLIVVPVERGREFQNRPGVLAIFQDPALLVVEVWSASTGDFDIKVKVPIYQQRGDREIWFIHPYDKTLTAWRRQTDGTYEETTFRGEGRIRLASLPGVEIDLAALFI
jgi:Uma2 family endonuclease